LQKRVVSVLSVGDGLVGISISANGQGMAVARTSNGGLLIEIWDIVAKVRSVSFRAKSEGAFERLTISADAARVELADSLRWSIFDSNTGRKLRTFDSPAVASPDLSRALLPDGKDFRRVRLVNAATGRIVRRLGGSIPATFSPDGSLIATGCAGGTNLASQTETVAIWTAAGTDAVKPCLGVRPAEATVWAHRTGRPIARIKTPRPAVPLAFSPDSKFLLVEEIVDNELLSSEIGGGNYGASLANGSPLLTLYEIRTGKAVRTFQGFASPVNSIAVAPTDSGDRLAVGTRHGTWVWDLLRGLPVQQLVGQFAAISPDGKSVISGGPATAITEKNVETGETKWDLLLPELAESKVFAFSPTSVDRSAVGANDGTVVLYVSGLDYLVLKSAVVTSLAFAPDNAFLVTGHSDGKARLWKNLNRSGSRYEPVTKEDQTFNAAVNLVSAVAVSPDGKSILTGSWDKDAEDNSVRLWNVDSGEALTMKRHTRGVNAVAFSPDGRLALSGADDGIAVIWDLQTLKPLRDLRGHAGPVRSVTFTSDGQFAITGGADSTVRFWDLRTGRPVCKLIAFKDGSWAVVDEEGHFDASDPERMPGLHWIFPDSPMEPLAPEVFMRQYLEPRLLSRILKRESFRSAPGLEKLNRSRNSVGPFRVDGRRNLRRGSILSQPENPSAPEP
jgi:WD40 repeat protein